MAYISYKDVPLYFGAENTVNLPTSPFYNRAYCQQVQLNYTPNISPARILGTTPNADNFNLSGPPNASLSFTAYAENSMRPTRFTGDVGNLGTTFRIGDDVSGISGSGAFLTSYSYTLTPYSPVLVQYDFAIYSPLTISNAGGKIAAESTDIIGDVDFSDYGHGAYSTFGGTPLNDISVFESIQYQYSANRLPVYEIGSFYPSAVELLTEEHSVQVQGDNIQALVPMTGSNPGNIEIRIKDSVGSTEFSMDISGRITAENISVSAGDLARGSITITELLK